MKSTEIAQVWRAVPGYEGAYEVSERGRVRSLPREVKRGAGTMKIPGREMTPTRQEPAGHLWVWLSRSGKRQKSYVHRLVAAAWHGPCREGEEVRHMDGNPENNYYKNLQYGTRSENMWDRVKHGNHPNKNKTHCVNGHEFTPENTYIRKHPKRPEYVGHRDCKKCRGWKMGDGQ